MATGLSAWIRPVQERADLERARASRAAEIARRHEQLMTTDLYSARSLHERMALIHRSLEGRHLTAARLHEAHVHRLRLWFVTDHAAADRRPLLISTVAEVLGARSAGITLLTSQHIEASVIASDPLAAAAQDLEIALGEGPVHDVTSTRSLVVVPESSLARRWPRYSPAVSALGVHSLAVAPLGLREHCVGALAVFDPPQRGTDQRLTTYLEQIADALTHIMLLTRTTINQLDEEAPADADSVGSLMDAADLSAVVHQATGMVAAQCSCSVTDALALIKARAFAANERVSTVAREIVAKRLRLDTMSEGDL
ncbi:GAF and ANTAR domain-containing protein [Kribbella sp. NPDC050124]|uniref:GAF and ANTAR domain-containing protein n=1 Tax=Kribbella sp. NPDC050124 TaxID=3364114 RepID=UPI0037B26D60